MDLHTGERANNSKTVRIKCDYVNRILLRSKHRTKDSMALRSILSLHRAFDWCIVCDTIVNSTVSGSVSEFRISCIAREGRELDKLYQRNTGIVLSTNDINTDLRLHLVAKTLNSSITQRRRYSGGRGGASQLPLHAAPTTPSFKLNK